MPQKRPIATPAREQAMSVMMSSSSSPKGNTNVSRPSPPVMISCPRRRAAGPFRAAVQGVVASATRQKVVATAAEELIAVPRSMPREQLR